MAFLGRSNVGKSSLINRLLAGEGAGSSNNSSGISSNRGSSKTSLARTSARPGCTQAVNFFQVDQDYRFVDLPGYGYAKVPKSVTQAWKALIESYLLGRGTLRLALIVLDARRGWMDKDLELKDWLEAHGRPYLVAATKVDKLKTQRERQQSRSMLRGNFAGEILECSAETGLGVREIWQAISKIKIRQ